MRETFHSEYGKIKSLLLKHSKHAFSSQDKIDSQWKELNYLHKPDYSTASQEYDQFAGVFNGKNIETHFLDENSETTMDSMYVRDASIATNAGMIICNMGKAERKPEPGFQKTFYKNNGIKIAGVIEEPGTIEGGDVAWIDESTLAVARGYRTNDAGIEQLKHYLEGVAEVLVYHSPHYKGPGDVFHLMSIFSPVDKDLAVVYSPLMAVPFREELLSRGYTFVEVPDEEFEMGCNVLAIAPRECVVVDGHPVTRSRLEAAGVKVHSYQGNHISLAGSGGPTCLTRPLVRLVD